MKKIILVIYSVIVSFAAQAEAPAVVTGEWNRRTGNEVTLYHIVSGRMEPLATYKLQQDRKFGFAFQPVGEGFYVIGSGPVTMYMDKYIFYFKPGDHLNVAFNDSTYTLQGKNTLENEALARWHDVTLLAELKSIYSVTPYGGAIFSTYVDFFPLLDELLAFEKIFATTTANPYFEAAFAQYRKYDLLHYAMMMVLTPRGSHPSSKDFTDYYRAISIYNYTKDASLLAYPYGSAMLGQIELVERMVQGTTSGAYVGAGIARVQNDTMKGEMALAMTSRLKSYDVYMDFEKEYGKYMLTADQQQRMKNALVAIVEENKNALQAVEFSGTDKEGKTVSLSDFKGKIVVVDVWATWCAPCRKELPFLKKLEKEFASNPQVVFLGISVDDAKNKQKWLNYLQKENLKGVQLFAGNGMDSDIVKFYTITTIPRFMLFDQDGKLVTANAPFPSTPDLKILIETVLRKK